MMNNNMTTTIWSNLWDRLRFHVGQLFYPAVPATRPGMGAVPDSDEGSVSFRVWAPHAERVFVVGEFNDWSPWRTPLARENGGGHAYWSTDVAEARPGDAYRYLIHHGRERLMRTDPFARAVSGEHDNGIIVGDLAPAAKPAAPSDYATPAVDELIIYELHVGTFAAQNGRGGTFDDVIDKLPYLKELGINAIELMPVAGFPGERSWGYNPSHLFAVAEPYGGRAALKALIAAAHAHGIAVIVDVVYNHFGPDRLSLWRFDGWHENGSGGIYFYNDWRNATPWGHTRPDYGRPEVRQFIRDNVMMWLDEFDVDGLRWDATSYIRNAHGHDGDPGADIAEGWQMMQQINGEMGHRYPGRLRIAEDMQGNDWLVKEPGGGGAGFDAQWDAPFAHTVRAAVIGVYDETRDLDAVAAALTGAGPERVWERVIFTESHDEVANGKARVPEEIAPGDAQNRLAQLRAMLGAGLVFTAPGIPMIFQGQEFGMDGWFDDQVPLPWDKAAANDGVLCYFQALTRLRRNAAGVSGGLRGPHIHVYHLDHQAKVMAFHRWHHGGRGDDVVVVANFSHQPAEGMTLGFPHGGAWRVRLNSGGAAFGVGDGAEPAAVVNATAAAGEADNGSLGYEGVVTIPPYALVVFSQDVEELEE